jgi:hypothetical protein
MPLFYWLDGIPWGIKIWILDALWGHHEINGLGDFSDL